MERSLASAAPVEQFPTCREHYENIDVLVELQESYRTKAAKNISCAQARQKRQYDVKHNTLSRILIVGDKVLKENSTNNSQKGGKLENPWTGPFYIHEDLGKGRYKLKTESGEILKQTIHCARLKLYRDPIIEVEAENDHSKQDVVGDQNVCNEVKSGCAKAAASKQEVIEGSGEDEKSCMKNECIVAVNSSSSKDSEETHLIKPFGISLKAQHHMLMLQHITVVRYSYCIAC